MTASLQMRAPDSVLMLVDYQERLMPAIHDGAAVLDRAVFLARVARDLDVPVVATAQNPSRLGANMAPLPEYVAETVEKMTFGGCGPDLDAALSRLDEVGAATGRTADIVIGGCEAHVCLLQTALGLLSVGRRVWVVADACGSRRAADRDAALARLRHAGAGIVTAEMVAFEWLATAAHPCFRAVSALIKEL